MKFDSKLLLEQLIQSELLEVSTRSSKIIPWTGNKLSRKLNQSGRGAVAGFTIVLTGDNISKDRIVQEIKTDVDYGVSSQFSDGRYVYITSKPIGTDNKTKYNVTIFNDTSKYYTTDFELDFTRNYQLIPIEIKRKYNLADAKVFSSPYLIGSSDFIFYDDISRREQYIDRLMTQITLMATIGPEYAELGVDKLELEKRVKELESELKQKQTQPIITVPVPDETDDVDDVITPITPTQISYPITKNSDSNIIRQLQRDIISMIDNNPEIYPDPGTDYRPVFDRFIKTYGADGKWGVNTDNMIKLINVGFNDTESTTIDKSTYDLIRKYQTSKISL
jgi:hypothetical protein